MKRADFPSRVHPPFALKLPKRQTLPVIVVSAHSGDRYPASFLAQAAADRAHLRHSEDWAVDRLAGAAPGFGAPLLAATFPRVLLDANREPFELDPTMFATKLPDYVNARSAWVKSGHGTLHRQAADGTEIYGKPLDFAEALDRIERYYLPFHAQLERLIRGTVRRFGICILLDCHSMPSSTEAEHGFPVGSLDFVLGDAGGRSCAPSIMARADGVLARRGWRGRRNDPFSGAFITRHYGHPENGVHALQLEINRALYMDERRLRATAGFEPVAHAIAELVAGLGAQGLAIAGAGRKAATGASLDWPYLAG
ncbi:MAG TPA: N-formylglutamate amidohydrolase [Alphaproteobacteria bacterium]|nr:N-formylglutamate amidohydrolase [Alphaproteobacteria bacterium]